MFFCIVMKEKSNKLDLIIQILIPFLISFLFYIFEIKEEIKVVMSGWKEADFYDMMKFYIWAFPIIGIVFSAILTSFSFVLGLPIRYVTKVNNFCLKHSSVFIWTFVIGLLLFIISYISPFSSMKEMKIFQYEELVLAPNFSMNLISSFLINFSVLHFCYLRLSKNKKGVL